MINHLRTLLINEDGPHLEQVNIPGDVYIPAYEKLTFTPDITEIMRLLYGNAPDYNGKLYRTAQYMGILHSTEYAAYIYNLDPRITYDPDDMNVMEEGIYGIVSSDGLTVTGTWNDAGAVGRLTTQWRVTATSPTELLVENHTDKLSDIYSLTDVKQLIGSPLVFSIATQPYTPGDSWEITYTARPAPDVGVVLANLRSLSTTALAGVFGVTPRAEPFNTFYNLFKQHYAMPYQLSGILLALAYTIETQRTGE